MSIDHEEMAARASLATVLESVSEMIRIATSRLASVKAVAAEADEIRAFGDDLARRAQAHREEVRRIVREARAERNQIEDLRREVKHINSLWKSAETELESLRYGVAE